MNREQSKPTEALDDYEYVSLYRTMVLIRRFQARALELRAARRIVGPVHPCTGQEAIATGICAALRVEDRVVSTYRGQGHAIAKGVDLTELTAELFGRRDGLNGGKAANHFSDPLNGLLLASGIVGGGVPIAAGAAMAIQLQGDDRVAVCFFGDGAMGAGVVHETLNIASAQRLPLVLVCENNSYQAGTRSEDVFPSTELARLAVGHELTAQTVDGNDVEAVRRAAVEAISGAREGRPSFLEMKTYLTSFHMQFDEPSRELRPPHELGEWIARDPLDLAETSLKARGIAHATLQRVREDVDTEIESAVIAAEASPWPSAEALFEHSHVASPA